MVSPDRISTTTSWLSPWPPRAARFGDMRVPRRVVPRGGVALTMDPSVDFEQADVLIEGKKIAAVRPGSEALGQASRITPTRRLHP